MITPDELAKMRSVAALSLPDLATIQSVTRSSDGMGGYTQSWSTRAANVPCRLTAKTARGLTQAGQWVVTTTWTALVPYSETVLSGDRLVANGDTFEVLSVEDDHSDRTLRRATLQRLD